MVTHIADTRRVLAPAYAADRVASVLLAGLGDLLHGRIGHGLAGFLGNTGLLQTLGLGASLGGLDFDDGSGGRIGLHGLGICGAGFGLEQAVGGNQGVLLREHLWGVDGRSATIAHLVSVTLALVSAAVTNLKPDPISD